MDQYCCATAIYLLSMLAHAYNIIIDYGVVSIGYGIEFVDCFNANEKRLISMLMTTLQLSGAAAYDLHMAIHTSTANTDISLAREFQKHLSDPT